jgi:hypothetical protein
MGQTEVFKSEVRAQSYVLADRTLLYATLHDPNSAFVRLLLFCDSY